MRGIDRQGRADDKANRVRRPSGAPPESPDGLSPRHGDHVEEVRRALTLLSATSPDKASVIAGKFDLRRTQFYDRLKKPKSLQVGEITTLADECPDPEFIPKFCGALLAWHAARTFANRTRARVLMLAGGLQVETTADPESLRRATGQHLDGDD